MQTAEWFESWFDSPFYHILYKDRDSREAETFIDNLISFLKPEKGSKILDLACGSGRHAIHLADKGYEVTGLDLSPSSIKAAKKYSSENLHFEVCDMRKVYKTEHFDYIFSLFTSLGYFATAEENYSVFKAMSAGLKEGGTLVIDYMNSIKALSSLTPKETCIIDNIEFSIQRKAEKGSIVKTIEFRHDEKQYKFEERVKTFQLADFDRFLSKYNMKTQLTFGDYGLSPFSEQNSERLIIIAKLNNGRDPSN